MIEKTVERGGIGLNVISNKSDEFFALEMAIRSKTKLGKSADSIFNWFGKKSCILQKGESPDFIIKDSSDVIGIEHFQVSTGSVMKKGEMQSLPNVIDSALRRKNKGKSFNGVKTANTYKQAMVASNYSDSICAFEYNFNKHLEKVGSYKKRLCDEYGSGRLIFIIEMLFWDFTGLTAVGEKTFDWGFDNIPLSKDIVDIISEANNIDAVVILFNFEPDHDSTVFAFTPQEAKNGDVGVEIYKYVGYGEQFEKELIELVAHLNGVQCDSILTDIFSKAGNPAELTIAAKEIYQKSRELILSGQPCLVATCVYDMMVRDGFIEDKRAKRELW